MSPSSWRADIEHLLVSVTANTYDSANKNAQRDPRTMLIDAMLIEGMVIEGMVIDAMVIEGMVIDAVQLSIAADLHHAGRGQTGLRWAGLYAAGPRQAGSGVDMK